MLKGRKKIPEGFCPHEKAQGLNFIRLATKDICILITTEAKQYIDTKGAVCEKGRIKQAQIETRQITTSELLQRVREVKYWAVSRKDS